MFTVRLAALLFSASLVCATPVARDMIVHERRSTAPSGFVHSGPAPAEHTLNLRINLVSSDLAGLEQALNAASFPSSPSYGQWLSKEEVCTSILVIVSPAAK